MMWGQKHRVLDKRIAKLTGWLERLEIQVNGSNALFSHQAGLAQETKRLTDAVNDLTEIATRAGYAEFIPQNDGLDFFYPLRRLQREELPPAQLLKKKKKARGK